MRAIEFHTRVAPEIKVSASVHHDTAGDPVVVSIEVMGIQFTSGDFFDHVAELILEQPELYDELSSPSASGSSLAA